MRVVQSQRCLAKPAERSCSPSFAVPVLDFALCACSKRGGLEQMSPDLITGSYMATGWEKKKKRKRKGKGSEGFCLCRSSPEYKCFLPPGHKHRSRRYLCACLYPRCVGVQRGKRNLRTYAHPGGLSSTSDLIPRVAPPPGPSWVPVVLPQASFRQTVLPHHQYVSSFTACQRR